MGKQLRYSFVHIDACNMCGDDSANARVLGKRMNRSQSKNPRNKTGISTTVVKCSKCGLIYSNPLPLPESLQDHYDLNPEEYWKDDYFTADPNYFSQEIKTLKSIRDFPAGSKSLDIGSGIGKCMISLSANGFDAYGFEPSNSFYERSISIMKLSPEKQVHAGMDEAAYPDNTFDFITFGAVLEHLPDPSAAILKAMKWLKPEGIMHIEVPSSDWLVSKLINFYYFIRGTDYVGNISPMHPPYHLYEFSHKSFEEHARKNNYEIALRQNAVCQSYMPAAVDAIIRPYMKMTDTGMQLIIWLRKK
jgi:2-polyprenyl-3-methyl-5-hydroxy-6-metoxy-1,4-benzoquinol methylase